MTVCHFYLWRSRNTCFDTGNSTEIMEIRTEKAFPRGGIKPALYRSKKNFNFSPFKKPKVKAKNKTKKNDINKETTIIKHKNFQPRNPFEVKYVEDLKPSLVQEGMLVLGIVSQITEKLVNISLPGRLRGVVTLANVSELYKKMIENEIDEIPSLRKLFQVGDILPVQVLPVSDNYSSLILTCDPKCVNHKLSYNLIEEGLILTGSVKSQEDYGFIIDFGIENLKGFLNYKKVAPDRNLIVGQIVRCCIMKCNQSLGSCHVEVSTLKKDLGSAVIKKNSSLPLYCFVPGFQFYITYQKKLKDGLEVSYGKKNSAKGYIYEEHLFKKFPSVSDIKIGSQSVGTLLYIKPLVNFLHFKIMPKELETLPFQYGEIVSGKVFKVTKSGIYFKVIEGSKKAKCFVPLLKLRNAEKLLENKSDIENLYPVGKKLSKIRLGHINLMGRFYFGATDRASLAEKYYSVSDIKCGDVVSCKILSFGKSSARLQISKTITGIVAFGDMTDIPLQNPNMKFDVGQTVKARVLEIIPENKFIRLTMKPTLIKEKKILCSLEDCRKGRSYTGTIVNVMHNNLKILFFNHITGIVPKHLTPFPDTSLLTNFSKRQLVKCKIVSFENNELFLSLLNSDSSDAVVVGKKYKVRVSNITQSGLLVDVEVEENKKCQGYLPAVLLTPHYSLYKAFHSTYTKGETLMAYCISITIKMELPLFGSAEIFSHFYEEKSEEELHKNITEDSIIPFLFLKKDKKRNILVLYNLIPGKQNWRVFVRKDDFSDGCFLTRYQLLYGKIVKVLKEKMDVSIQLYDVWDRDYHSSLDFFDSYLKSLNVLVMRQKEKIKAYNQDFSLGCSVKGKIEEIRTNTAVLKTDGGDLCIIEGKFNPGQEASGRVVWIDASEQIIYIREKIGIDGVQIKRPSITSKNYYLRAKVLFIYEEATVVELRGRGNGHLAFIPRRRHLNDFYNSENVFVTGEEIKVWITRKESNYLLAMDYRVIALQEKALWKKYDKKLRDSVQSLKRKLEKEKRENKKRKTETESEIEIVDIKLRESKTEGSDLPEVKEEIEDDGDLFTTMNNSFPRLEYDDIEIKSEKESEEKENPELVPGITNEERIILSSSSEDEADKDKETENSSAIQARFKIGFNWDVLSNQTLLSGVVTNKDESSDDEDEKSKSEKKRKYLTASEKREKAKNEEERLRLIEKRLMDADREPENADDFDRAVLANPDSSVLWLKYMAFHIQGTEIEKARAVAVRAMKAISFREEQDKLNIWIALLNLENMYGNEDSLNKTLSEALQSNDPYKIHLHMLNIHGQSNRFQEMEKLGNLILKKYKDVGSMWHDVASAYFSVGKVESARNVLQKALSLVDKSIHVPLISKFAQLENKYGSPERAQTLYESILSSFPKRIDIWCCYVDMLVKSNLIDLARQVLERAISQTLRPRKMKTLFKKFITFEEAHGTPETVEKVREAAVNYVQTVGSMDV